MDFKFTEEHEMMRKMVSSFAENEITPHIEAMETGVFPKTILQKMGELGLMGIPISEEYGGAGMDFMSYIIAINEISKVSPTLGVILSVHTSVGTNPIVYFGTEEQKRKYVPKLAAGKNLGAFCLTEQSSGSDAASLKSKAVAVKEGGQYRINGSKVFITNGGEADVFIVFASTDPQKGSKGISAFIVEKGTTGLIIGKDERKMGLHGSSTVQVTFEDMKIPAANLLGKEGEGFKIAMANLDAGRIGIAAQALGIAEGAMEHAVRYAKSREQFGKPIAEQQGIGFKLAEMATSIEASRLLVYRAAFLRSQGLKSGKEAAMAKLFASRTAVEVAIEAVQVFGAMDIQRIIRSNDISEMQR